MSSLTTVVGEKHDEGGDNTTVTAANRREYEDTPARALAWLRRDVMTLEGNKLVSLSRSSLRISHLSTDFTQLLFVSKTLVNNAL